MTAPITAAKHAEQLKVAVQTEYSPTSDFKMAEENYYMKAFEIDCIPEFLKRCRRRASASNLLRAGV
jgi:hypothetical protein